MIIEGAVYRHYKGGEYEVIAVCNIGLADPIAWVPTVAYVDIKTGAKYARPLSEFTEDKYICIHSPSTSQ